MALPGQLFGIEDLTIIADDRLAKGALADRGGKEAAGGVTEGDVEAPLPVGAEQAEPALAREDPPQRRQGPARVVVAAPKESDGDDA